MVPDYLEVDLLPLILTARPARLAHQANDSLLLGPALFDRHVGQVGRAVSPTVVDKADAQPVRTELPVPRPRGVLEVGEQRDGNLERRQLARGDGVEARVMQSRRQRIGGETLVQLLLLEGTDATAQAVAVSRRDGVPRYEEGGLGDGGSGRGRGGRRDDG